MKITEIFYSIQGEGPQIGMPAVFIRLAGCNLSCLYCDTTYSWKKDEIVSIEMSNEQVMDIISFECEKFDAKPELIIFTGGEPLLQQTKICDLIEYLGSKMNMYNGNASVLRNLKYISFETNGTVVPNFLLLNIIKPFNPIFVISPKLQFSKFKDVWTKHSMLNGSHDIYFKFVVENKDSLDDIQLFLNYRENIRQNMVYLMPEALSVADQVSKLDMVFDFAKRYNYRVTPRIHIMAYGNVRGV